MPKKLSPKNKDKAMTDVVDFLRRHDIDEGDVDDPTLRAITNLAGIDMPRGDTSPRQKALDYALEWLRNTEPDSDSIDEPMLTPLSKVTGTMLPAKMTPEN